MKTVLVDADEPPSAASRRHSVSRESISQNAPAPSLKAAPVRRIRPEFRMSERSAEFLRRFYPDATADNWNDWRWQNRSPISSG